MDRKFNVIRIPIKYTKQIDILTEKQQLYIYRSLGALGRGDSVKQRDSMEFYILSNIFEEWMSMESKNGNKSEKSLTKYLSELPAQVNASYSGAIVQDNTVQDSKVKDIYIGATRSEVLEELDKIINHWNNTWNEKRVVTEKLQEVYLKVRKTYNKDIIAQSLTNYKEEKKDAERQYRLDPLRFFTQSNGYLTYV